MITVTFETAGTYRGRNGVGELTGVDVEGGDSWMCAYVRNSKGASDACWMEFPKNHADMVAIAILMEFIPQAAGMVGLKPDTPWYMVTDKLADSEDDDHRILAQMLLLAYQYGTNGLPYTCKRGIKPKVTTDAALS